MKTIPEQPAGILPPIEPGPYPELRRYGSTLTENDIRCLRDLAGRPGGQAVLAVQIPPAWVLGLAARGYGRLAPAVSGPLGLQTGERVFSITEAGRVAVAIAGPKYTETGYRALHAVCPRCFQTRVEETAVGCVGDRATCRTSGCGWAGIVHDMVPADPVRAALVWYGEMARLARLIHAEGDRGRNAIAADGGAMAGAALFPGGE